MTAQICVNFFCFRSSIPEAAYVNVFLKLKMAEDTVEARGDYI